MSATVPPYKDMLWVNLRVLISLGGSASINELDQAVIAAARWTEDQQQILHNGGPKTELEYRLAWARTYLKFMGLVTNSSRGVWSVTDQGRAATQEQIPVLHAEAAATIRRNTRLRAAGDTGARHAFNADSDIPNDLVSSAPRDDPLEDIDWKDRLLETLLALPPARFEHLAQHLLREAGFLRVTVTGQSGDGGIDGIGIYKFSLLSFPVFFQCKRYRGSVGSSAVRDFRGAMTGRGDKGLLITTGTFTADARAEASRDGAPHIDLIDGDHLCDLLRTYQLGVTTTVRQVEDITINTEYFGALPGA